MPMLQPKEKPAPAPDGAFEVKKIGAIHRDAIPIFIYSSVLEEILDYSDEDTARELGGFLVGGLFEDGRKYVEVRHFLPAVDVHSRAASLTFTHDTWATMSREVEQRYPDSFVVGWHHTHPNFGIFLSGYDMFIHQNFFSEYWQIALVVDPIRHEFGFFQWQGEQVVDCGFLSVSDVNV